MDQANLYFDARARADVLASLESTRFDVVVIGGGINGAGAAYDAALRGLSVLLIEQDDLAFGTSSRSSKLIHGGLRYLEHYQFKLVFEGTNERAVLRKIAPHLVRPMMFALPIYESDRHPLWFMDVGLWMYDTLSLFKVEKRHITLRSPKRMLEREPCLDPDGLTGGIIYYDCITDDARLTLENALAASRLGARIVTYARVTGIEGLQDADGPTVCFQDRWSQRDFRVGAKAIVNCTGAWTDQTRALAEVESQVVRPTKGVHLVIPHERLPVHHANALLSPQDGRVFFAIPWNGRTVLGTTDTDYDEAPGTPAVTEDDASYLLTSANHRFPGRNLTMDDVLSTWVGLRPLIRADPDASASDVPREHQLFQDGPMVTVAGGKLTTYRRMAAEIVDRAVAGARLSAKRSRTGQVKLPGAEGLVDQAVATDFERLAETLGSDHDLPEDVATRLVNVYGSRASDVARYLHQDPALRSRVCPDRDVIYAEVAHAVDCELAQTVDDVLVRRTSLTLTAEDQGLGAAERVAEVMGARLGWSDADRQGHIDRFVQNLELTRAFRRR